MSSLYEAPALTCAPRPQWLYTSVQLVTPHVGGRESEESCFSGCVCLCEAHNVYQTLCSCKKVVQFSVCSEVTLI